MKSLINKVVADDKDSAANPNNATFAVKYAESIHILCRAIEMNGQESTILMNFLRNPRRNFDFSQVHPCENCGYVYCDNELCKVCAKLVDCAVCGVLVTECNTNLFGVCSDCVINAEDYKEQREMQDND